MILLSKKNKKEFSLKQEPSLFIDLLMTFQGLTQQRPSSEQMYYSLSFVCSFKRRLSQCPFAGTSKREPSLHHRRHSIFTHNGEMSRCFSNCPNIKMENIKDTLQTAIPHFYSQSATFHSLEIQKGVIKNQKERNSIWKVSPKGVKDQTRPHTAPPLPLNLEGFDERCQTIVLVYNVRSATAIIDCEWLNYQQILLHSCTQI